MYELRHYTTLEGQDLFGQWRVYYALQGKRVVLLCDGGDKRSQAADINRAIERWSEWQQRGKK